MTPKPQMTTGERERKPDTRVRRVRGTVPRPKFAAKQSGRRKQWLARFRHADREYNLGYYATEEEAQDKMNKVRAKLEEAGHDLGRGRCPHCSPPSWKELFGATAGAGKPRKKG